MNITELLSRRTEVDKQISFLTGTVNSKQILIQATSQMWVGVNNKPRLHAALVEVLDKELTHLFEESMSINNKIDAINTLLSQD